MYEDINGNMPTVHQEPTMKWKNYPYHTANGIKNKTILEEATT